MRDVRLLRIGARELWLGSDKRYFGRQWRGAADEEMWLDEAEIPFSNYDRAVEWLNEPPVGDKALGREKTWFLLSILNGTASLANR